MAAHSTTQLRNGHTLTIVQRQVQDGLGVPAERVGKPYFAVEGRNSLGTYVGTVYTAHTLAECEAWVARAAERGYSDHPSIGERREAAESRRRAMLGDDDKGLLGAMADQIATENPADAIRGWLAGSEAYGLTWEAKLYRRALELSEGRPTACERIRAAREEHSGSRRVDVLVAEAPELVAPAKRELRIVIDVESDEPQLLGTYSETEESAVWYITTEGRYTWANDDCVRVVKVEL